MCHAADAAAVKTEECSVAQAMRFRVERQSDSAAYPEAGRAGERDT
jgi:hypothetical protein